MANYIVTGTQLTDIANAIRTKSNINAPMSFPDGFISGINDISSSSLNFDGLEYETGIVKGKYGASTFIPPDIQFANTHDYPPFYIALQDITTPVDYNDGICFYSIFNFKQYSNQGFSQKPGSTGTNFYWVGIRTIVTKNTSDGSHKMKTYSEMLYEDSNSNETDMCYITPNMTNTHFRPDGRSYGGTFTGKFINNHNYKWIAIWNKA